MINFLPFEWFLLLLRVCFIFLLYFFLFQVVRVIIRELVAEASSNPAGSGSSIGGHLIVRASGDSGLRAGTSLELDPVTVIGRHPRATIRIEDSYVSSEHAQISWTDGRWWVTDLNSTNGTVLNDLRLTAPTGLHYGDIISIGDIQLQLAP